MSDFLRQQNAMYISIYRSVILKMITNYAAEYGVIQELPLAIPVGKSDYALLARTLFEHYEFALIEHSKYLGREEEKDRQKGI